MRVLVIETTVFGYDGITNVVTNYYKYQDHNRVHMDIVTINEVSSDLKEFMAENKSLNYVLPYRNNHPFKYLVSLIHIIKKGNYQIIHAHGCSATMGIEMLAGKLAGVKVRIAHSHNTKCDHVRVDKILRPIFNTTCNVRFACGKEAGEWLFPGKDFSVIFNGIDLEKFQYNVQIREQMRKQYDLDGKFVIGHVGRFSVQKNHDKLLGIFKCLKDEVKDAKLVLVGDGELREKMEKKASNNKLDVLFVGLTDEVGKWLQAMDMIVFPSLYEGLPVGLVEAQAAGLPCILSGTISLSTRITDLVTFVDLDGDEKLWVKQIKSNRDVFNRADRVEYVKEQIRRSHFDIKQNCVDIANKYEELVRKNGEWP